MNWVVNIFHFSESVTIHSKVRSEFTIFLEVNSFYESIDKLNLPTENIYFITNNLIAEKTHNEYNRKDKINVISIMWNVFDVQRLKKLKHLPNKINIQNEIDYKEINSTKYFLKINRTNRAERDLFMLFLEYENLLDKCLISFPQLDGNGFPPHNRFKKYTTAELIKSLESFSVNLKVIFFSDNFNKFSFTYFNHCIHRCLDFIINIIYR